MLKISLFFSLLFVCACTSRIDRSKHQKNVPIQWHYLTLEFNDTVIQLTDIIDTLEVATFEKGMQKYLVDKLEKDSLFTQVNELIDFKGQPKRFCTDYVGKLKIRIRYNDQLLKEVSFTSICDWRELNANTNSIDQLLKKMIRSK